MQALCRFWGFFFLCRRKQAIRGWIMDHFCKKKNENYAIIYSSLSHSKHACLSSVEHKRSHFELLVTLSSIVRTKKDNLLNSTKKKKKERKSYSFEMTNVQSPALSDESFWICLIWGPWSLWLHCSLILHLPSMVQRLTDMGLEV